MTKSTSNHEGTRATKPSDMPPAGPHAKSQLTDEDKTPGAGALPDPDPEQRKSGDVDPGAG